MTMDINAEYEASLAELDALKADLGDAIQSGASTTALKAKLVKAEETVEANLLAMNAVAAASQRAAQREAVEVEAKRQVEIEKQWKQAEIDYADIVATANACERNFEKQKELLQRMRHQSRAFSENYRGLGCNAGAMSVLRNENWQSQLLLLLREQVPGMRQRLAGVHHLSGFSPTASLMSHVPAFDTILPRRAKKEAA